MSANQIQKLKEEKKNLFSVDLVTKDIFQEIDDNLVNSVVENLDKGIDVVVHCSEIKKEIDDEQTSDMLIEAGIARPEFAGKITELIDKINSKTKFNLILIGGETSYKCLTKVNSSYLEIVDSIMPSIPLCIDNNNKFIVTKSGNFGTSTTLIDILNYFDKAKNV